MSSALDNFHVRGLLEINGIKYLLVSPETEAYGVARYSSEFASQLIRLGYEVALLGNVPGITRSALPEGVNSMMLALPNNVALRVHRGWIGWEFVEQWWINPISMGKDDCFLVRETRWECGSVGV